MYKLSAPILVFLLFGGISLDAQSDQNARDLVKLSTWFEGSFDNDSQLWFEGRRGWKGNEEEKHGRIHATHIRINAPEIGEHVFYVEEFLDGDSAKVARQRIVSFESVPDSAHMLMKLYFLKDAAAVLLAKNQNTFSHTITMDQLFSLDGCDVVIRRKGEQYEGGMRYKDCQFGEGDKLRYSVHDIIISQDQYWRVDQTYLVSDDSFHAGHSTSVPHKMRRTKNYACDIAFHEKTYYQPSDKDKRYMGVIIHNQGGSQWFLNPVTGKRYMVQLREKEYPFYKDGSDFFMLRFKEEEALASTVIVTASPGTKAISFQIGWASTSCQLIEED